MNPIFYIDFYKVGHVWQYVKGIKQIWANWTARYTRVPGKHRVVNMGITFLCRKYLQEEFNQMFFGRALPVVLNEYRQVLKDCLGVTEPDTSHIEALWRLGHLPIEIYSVPEGWSVPLNVPAIVVTNTHPDFFWLPNYIETLMSSILWIISTSATTAQRYRKVMVKWAVKAGENDLGFVDWMGHDFSFRGMEGVEGAILSGLGHLAAFNGTDTIPAILAARQYYGADLKCGGSVAATEHSVMCAGGQEGEFETFRRLLTEVYPSGIVSIVSDTWDLWKVLTDYVPRMRDQILARNGKIVIRPDSGDPVKICIGNPSFAGVPHDYFCERHPAEIGVVGLLARALGTVPNPTGSLPLINKGGVIYGDGISVERCDDILGGIVLDHKLSPYNMVFGIGSYSYQYTTRDTYGWAMKATAVRVADDSIMPIFKKPITDDGGKFSHRGIPVVYRTEESTEDRPDFFVVQDGTPKMLADCAFEKVFSNGVMLVPTSLETIRKRVRTV